MTDNGNELAISFATGGFDHIIRMWNPRTGRYIQGFQHNESQVNALAFTLDGHFLAAAGFAKVRIYDVHGGSSPMVVISEFTKNVNSVGHNAAGNWMFAGGEDKVAKIIDWRASSYGSPCVTASFQCGSSINSMVLHPNQLEILFSTDKGEIYVWDLRNCRATLMCSEPCNGPILSLGINVEGTSLTSGNVSGNLVVWSLAGNSAFTHTEKHRGKVHPSYILKTEFSPDSTLLATCGADGNVNLLKTADFSVSSKLRVSGAAGGASSAIPTGSGGGTTAAGVGSGGGHIWAWDCAFSADSRYLLTASSDGVARLWNLETEEVRLVYKGHQRAITCLAFRDQSLSD